MHSMNCDLTDSYTNNKPVSSQSIQSEPIHCAGAMNSRYHQYSSNYDPLVPIEFSSTQSTTNDLDSNLSYMQSNYYPSQSFNLHINHMNDANSVDSQEPSPPCGNHTYASLRPVTLPLISMNDRSNGQFQNTIPFSNSGQSTNYLNNFSRNSTSAPLQNMISSRLPDLHTSAHCRSPIQNDLAYITSQSSSSHLPQPPPPHLMHSSSGLEINCQMRDSPNASLVSPSYSPSSVTTQGSSQQLQGHGSVDKPGFHKLRSKKESHNRIERRRRDFINSQIIRLSGLLPSDMYRDVDGRRNKGTVLRLSVSYIMELRQAVLEVPNLREETGLARQLIPLLLNHIQSLERLVKEITTSDKLPNFSPDASIDGALEAWKGIMEANIARLGGAIISKELENVASGGSIERNSDPQTSINVTHRSTGDLRNLPLFENVQVSFSSRPSQIQIHHKNSPSHFLPNANYNGHDNLLLNCLKQEHVQDEGGYQLNRNHQLPCAADLQTTDKYNEYVEKSNDQNEEFFQTNSSNFNDMMHISTDCVE